MEDLNKRMAKYSVGDEGKVTKKGSGNGGMFASLAFGRWTALDASNKGHCHNFTQLVNHPHICNKIKSCNKIILAFLTAFVADMRTSSIKFKKNRNSIYFIAAFM